MHIAFGIVNLFAGGGLQRDCVRFARLLRERGHEVTIFTARRQADYARDLNVEALANNAWTNHGRNLQFARQFIAATSRGYEKRVGFDLLLGLDVLYCPHPSTALRVRRHPYLRLHPRYRMGEMLERASFTPGGKTQVLLLSQRQVEDFAAVWNTEKERIVLLPPTVSRERRLPDLRTDGTRERLRLALGLQPQDDAWLAIGAQPKTKGLDRTIRVLPEFPSARLLVAGVAASDAKARSFWRLASRLGVADRLHWLGFRDDVPELMAAADLLLHPARNDTTGTVILEAVINGLPVVVSAVCGYAEHVAAAKAGIAVPEPYDQAGLAAALRQADNRSLRSFWSMSGVVYGRQDWLYSAEAKVFDAIVSAR